MDFQLTYLKAEQLLTRLKAQNLSITAAESCTGGLLMAALTAVEGASAVINAGYITYSNTAKQSILGVPSDILNNYGAVSAEVAKAMAQGALEAAQADIALAITGIAGPGGRTATKPVGLVYVACATKQYDQDLIEKCLFTGDRSAVRKQAVCKALSMACKIVA